MTTTGMQSIKDSLIVQELDGVVGPGATVLSMSPVALRAPERPVQLEVRVSAPATGTRLPVIVFSHGNGWNLDGYGPLTMFWASRGFVVVQPTHLDSRRNAYGFDDPVFPSIWMQRYRDLDHIINQLDAIEAAVPGVIGRVDRERIAVAGHSWGAQTAGMLLGARIENADGSIGGDFTDSRVKAGMLLAATGIGGEELHPFAKATFPFMNPSFGTLGTPTLVVAGDHDQSAMSSRGPDWFTDAYTFAPGATDLLTLVGAEHSLGGIPGWEAAETTDEDPERVAVVQRLTTAYLRSALTAGDRTWVSARQVLCDNVNVVGRIDSK